MEKCSVLCKHYEKMTLLVLGTLLGGLIGGMILSIVGLLINMSFPMQAKLDPVTITYITGYIIALPVGALWFSKLLFKRNSKFWILLVASLAGFGVFLAYVFIAGLDRIIPILFFFIFHLSPWVTATLASILFLPKAQTPETAE